MANELRTTWEKTKLALFKLGVLFVFILLHWGLTALIRQVLDDQWHKAEKILFGLFLLAFTIIYVEQLWETVGLFVPRLEHWRKKAVESKIRTGGSHGHGRT